MRKLILSLVVVLAGMSLDVVAQTGWHISAASPARGAAVTIPNPPLKDSEGDVRPTTGADIGADQFSSIPSPAPTPSPTPRPSPTPTTAPGAPAGLIAQALNNHRVLLRWNDTSNEDGFSLERSLSSTSNFKEILRPGPGVISFTDGGVKRWKYYYYRIRAYNARGYSNYSSTIGVQVR